MRPPFFSVVCLFILFVLVLTRGPYEPCRSPLDISRRVAAGTSREGESRECTKKRDEIPAGYMRGQAKEAERRVRECVALEKVFSRERH